jgi:hypothetical protein
MVYNSFYMSILGYGTPSTTLTKKVFEEIQRPIMNAILHTMVVAWSAPMSIVFGMAHIGVLEITYIVALQGHTRLQYILGHLRCGDATEWLMQMLLEYTQLERGCRGNTLAQYYNKYSALIINTNWITEVWEHLHPCKVTVEVEGL